MYSANELIAREREEITVYPEDGAFVTFHCAYKMTLCVIWKKLPMDNVDVFAGINDHKVLKLTLALPQT